MTKTRCFTGAAAALALGAVSALATAEYVLPVQDYQGIPYVTGGVGLEEREALAQVAGNYNLKVTLAMQAGNYVSDVQITILDRQSNVVFEGVSNGPLLYTRLPPGSYTVQASGFGQQFQRSVQVSERGLREVAFYWR